MAVLTFKMPNILAGKGISSFHFELFLNRLFKTMYGINT